MEMKRVIVTPKIAEKMLERIYHKQRSVNSKKVAEYARDMLEGNWNDEMCDFDPIAINTKGELMNGQHRLRACVYAKSNFLATVVYNVPEELFEYMDGGLTRSTCDFVESKNKKPVTTLANFAYSIEKGMPLRTAFKGIVDYKIDKKGSRATRREILDYIHENIDTLEHWATQARKMYITLGRGGSQAGYAKALWLLDYLSNGNMTAHINEFVEELSKEMSFSPAVQIGKTKASRIIIDAKFKHQTVASETFIALTLVMYDAFCDCSAPKVKGSAWQEKVIDKYAKAVEAHHVEEYRRN